MAVYESFTLKNATKAELLKHFTELYNGHVCNYGYKTGLGSLSGGNKLNFLYETFATEKEASDFIYDKTENNRYVAYAAEFGKNNWCVGAVCRD